MPNRTTLNAPESDDAREHASPRDRMAPSTGPEASALRIAFQRKWSILAFALAMTGAAVLVLSRMPVLYASEAAVALDTRQLRVTTAEQLITNQAIDSSLLRTRMESLRSPQMARTVARKLGLATVPEYCAIAQPSSWTEYLWHTLKSLARSEAPADPSPCVTSVEDAAKHLMYVVSVDNDGRSYVIRINAIARDPQLAADIANAYANTFIAAPGQEMRQTSQQANAWLTSYISRLRERSAEAAAALGRYRVQHRIAPVQNGGSLAARNLTELNSRLNTVNNEIAEKRGVLRQLRELMRTDASPDASMTILALPSVQNLLTAQTQVLRTEAELRSRFGASHPDVQAAVAQAERLRRQLRLEAGKAEAALSGDLASLEQRRVALTTDVDDLLQKTTEQGRDDVELRRLEREAALSEELYGAMVTRLAQLDAEQGMQRPDAYIAAEALPSERAVYPRTKMILVGVFLTSCGVGTGVAVGARLLSRVFHRSDELEEQTGVPVLGLFPKPPRNSTPQDMIVDEPMSFETEAVHSILASLIGLSLDRQIPLGRVILVTSSVPGEGKTSFSVALGRLAARCGLAAVVVECDLRRPTVKASTHLSRPLHDEVHAQFQKLEPGCLPASEQHATLFSSPIIDYKSGMEIMPLVRRVKNPHEALASKHLLHVLTWLRSSYDVIILDTPPVLAVADPVRLAPLADQVVFLVSWRQVPKQAVAAGLRLLQRQGVHVSGAVLSKVNLLKYARCSADEGYLRKLYRTYTGSIGDSNA